MNSSELVSITQNIHLPPPRLAYPFSHEKNGRLNVLIQISTPVTRHFICCLTKCIVLVYKLTKILTKNNISKSTNKFKL